MAQTDGALISLEFWSRARLSEEFGFALPSPARGGSVASIAQRSSDDGGGVQQTKTNSLIVPVRADARRRDTSPTAWEKEEASGNEKGPGVSAEALSNST